MMIQIDFLSYKNQLKVRKSGEKLEIFDPVRGKYFILQPEEMVRQLVLQYLIIEKKYPLSKLRVEMGLAVNTLKKRCDILVFDKNFSPFFMVECKSAKIPINQDVFDQIARYNLKFKVPFLIVTNGIATYCSKIDFNTEGYTFLNEIPDYDNE